MKRQRPMGGSSALVDSVRTGAGAGKWSSAGLVLGLAPNMALRLSWEPFAQPWLILFWKYGLEHEASVGVNTKLVDVARTGVVHT